jgi:uracil-DNA glycosylase
MLPPLPPAIQQALNLADASWQPALRAGLYAMQQNSPDYLPALNQSNGQWLPNGGRLFAAFTQPLPAVGYVLVGEGPYPRPESATGVCFMDGAVTHLWSNEPGGGLSKSVNRATSLRNFIKMLAVAAGELDVHNTTGPAVAQLAQRARQHPENWIQALPELQQNLTRAGFLLLNASLVYRPEVPPLKDAQSWQPFMAEVLKHLAERSKGVSRPPPPTLVLWGKIADQLKKLPHFDEFPKAVSEHPYNLSFIANEPMQALFAPLELLRPTPFNLP